MPDDRRMTITSSSHLSPDEVAHHTFGSVRRGFDPSEVRAYLESVAAGLRAAAEHERELLAELADAEHRAANPVLEESVLSAAVGQETARVLHSAHEAAAEVTGRATEQAERLVADATEQAERLRSEAEAEAEARRSGSEAQAEEVRARAARDAEAAVAAATERAEALLAQTREECRAMVEESQQLRSKVLADLTRRRKALHAQIEQLRAGRERLAETVQEVRRSIDGIADELFGAEDDARQAAEAAGREVAGRADEDGDGPPGVSVGVAGLLTAPPTGSAGEPATGDGDVDGTAEAPTGSADNGVDGGVDAGGEPGAEPGGTVDALFAKLRAATGEEVDGDGAPAPTAGSGAADAGADAVDGEDGEDGPPEARDPSAVRRDEVVAPIVTALGRRLKRTLQDGQNELLDRLRANGSHWSADLLPDEVEHVDGVVTAALPALEQAAEAGGVFADTGSDDRPTADALIAVAHELADKVVEPLRRRLTADEELAGADEAAVAEHVGAAFREWKGERIERLAADHVLAAFSLGTLAATGGDHRLTWVADAGPGGTPCPDCEDNGLDGPQAPGDAFPTGHLHPPAHPGCRCLLAPATP